MAWLDAIVQGILLGGLYALFATGLSLTFGVMRLVNLAHGDFSILAAFIAVVVVQALGLNPAARAGAGGAGDGRRRLRACSGSCSTASSGAASCPPCW